MGQKKHQPLKKCLVWGQKAEPLCYRLASRLNSRLMESCSSDPLGFPARIVYKRLEEKAKEECKLGPKRPNIPHFLEKSRKEKSSRWSGMNCWARSTWVAARTPLCNRQRLQGSLCSRQGKGRWEGGYWCCRRGERPLLHFSWVLRALLSSDATRTWLLSAGGDAGLIPVTCIWERSQP